MKWNGWLRIHLTLMVMGFQTTGTTAHTGAIPIKLMLTKTVLETLATRVLESPRNRCFRLILTLTASRMRVMSVPPFSTRPRPVVAESVDP